MLATGMSFLAGLKGAKLLFAGNIGKESLDLRLASIRGFEDEVTTLRLVLVAAKAEKYIQK